MPMGDLRGLLMGVIINLAPELYNGVIAEVPFVDVVTTMLDDTIPLTTSEYDEWGNPNEKEFYDYMLSYSPYDQVRNKITRICWLRRACTIRKCNILSLLSGLLD